MQRPRSAVSGVGGGTSTLMGCTRSQNMSGRYGRCIGWHALSCVLGMSQQLQPAALWGGFNHSHTPTIPSNLRCWNCWRHCQRTFVDGHRMHPRPICITTAVNQRFIHPRWQQPTWWLCDALTWVQTIAGNQRFVVGRNRVSVLIFAGEDMESACRHNGRSVIIVERPFDSSPWNFHGQIAFHGVQQFL